MSTGASERLARIAAGVGAFAFLPAGLWAMADPRSFFDQVAEFHPYNQHFVQDVGAFQLGLGAVLLIVALWPRIDALAAALLGTGIGGTAHAVSHVIGHDLGGRPWSDIPMFTVIGLLLLGAGAIRARALAR
jgi:hypothetical protein